MAKKKEKTENWHADFKKGEVPTKKKQINLEYIKDYCKQDREKAEWFMAALDKYEGKKASHLKIRKDFVDKFYPEFNEKHKSAAHTVKPKTISEQYREEMQAFLDSLK